MSEQESGSRRVQLDGAANELSGLANTVEEIGTKVQQLVGEAAGVDAQIRRLGERLVNAPNSEIAAVADALTKAVKLRLDLSARGQDLNLRASQAGHSIRHLSGQVRPRTIRDTMGKVSQYVFGGRA